MSIEFIRYHQFIYDENLVTVIFQKPISKLKIGGVDYGSPIKGSELKIPRWAAKVLEEEGYVTIRDNEQLRSIDVIKLLWKEERSETLCKMPEKFYPKLRELLKILSENVKKNPTDTTISEQRQTHMKALDLINCRLQKIVRLSFERSPPKSSIDMLEPEEFALFKTLRSEIENWKQRIIAEGVE